MPTVEKFQYSEMKFVREYRASFLIHNWVFSKSGSDDGSHYKSAGVASYALKNTNDLLYTYHISWHGYD